MMTGEYQAGPNDPNQDESGGKRQLSRGATALIAGAIGIVIGLSISPLFTLMKGDSGDSTPQTGEDTTEAAQILRPALDACKLPPHDYAQIGDGGSTLTLKGQGEESSGLEWDRIDCVLKALNMPDSVDAHMSSTRALDGRQQATWEGISAAWTYHPKSGVTIILEDVRQDG